MKKRTPSQQTGDSGEKLFDYFANRQLGLVPNKVTNDYGIDYFCQDTYLMTDGSQDVRPTLIGAVVRSTAKKSRRPRVKLEKDDIELALRSEFPLLFVLVDLDKDKVHLRFLDSELLETFHDILSKGGQSFTLTPDIMYSGVHSFREALSVVTRPEYQHRLRLRAVEMRLTDLIGPVRLRIFYRSDRTLAIVQVHNVENLFSPEVRPQVREVLLTSRYDRPLPLPIPSLKDSVVGEVKRIASKIAIVAPVSGKGAESLFIKKNDKVTERCVFDLRRAGDEMAYHHPSGLSIVISAARKGKDGLYYHHTRLTYGDDSADRLFEHPEIIAFIKQCKKGGEICLGDPHKDGVPIEHGFSELMNLGTVVSHLEDIYSELGIAEPAVKFYHLTDPKIQWSHGLLASILYTDKQEDIFPGFALTPQDVHIDWVRSTVFCPLVLALPEGPSVVEVVFSGRIAFAEEHPAGARFDEYKTMRLCEPSEYGCELKEQPSSPLLLIDGKNAIKFHETRLEQVGSPCKMGIAYSPEE